MPADPPPSYPQAQPYPQAYPKGQPLQAPQAQIMNVSMDNTVFSSWAGSLYNKLALKRGIAFHISLYSLQSPEKLLSSI